MLAVRDLVVRYGSRVAVADLDLDVPDGRIVAVLGPSGSGKSTLLRAVAGLEPLAAGSIAWDGRDLVGVPPHRRGFGLMFQDYALFPHLDVAGNVAYGLRAEHLARVRIPPRVAEVLDLVGLGGDARRRVGTLSGGERQRVALARALAPSPRLLMLDEPLSSLDRDLREQLLGELRALFERLRLSVLTVTHDQEEAFALADDVVLLRDGRVEQAGPAEAVWHAPATEFAARFLGAAVLPAAAIGLDGPGHVAVRADAIALDPAGPVHAVVERRTFRRDHFLLHVRLPGGDALDARVPATATSVPEAGAAVRLRVEAGAALPLPAG